MKKKKYLEKCPKCGCKTFVITASTYVIFENVDGVLYAKNEENAGLGEVIVCDECGSNYDSSDFLEIITI